MTHYEITPVPKPRMTQADKWKKRPATAKYWAFKDECRGKAVSVPERAYICFMLPFPKGWNKAKRAGMMYQPHQGKPDLDNLIKALLDAVFDDDSHVHEIYAKKLWADRGGIIIEKLKR